MKNDGKITIRDGDLRNFGHIEGFVRLTTVSSVTPFLGDIDEFEMDVNGNLTVQDNCSFYRLLRLTNGTFNTNNFD